MYLDLWGCEWGADIDSGYNLHGTSSDSHQSPERSLLFVPLWKQCVHWQGTFYSAWCHGSTCDWETYPNIWKVIINTLYKLEVADL